MKIGLILDDSLDRNDGVQQYVRTLSSWLKNNSHEVHILAGQSQVKKNVHSLARNITVRYNGNRLSVPLPAHGRRIKELLAHEKYDVLHVQMPYSPMLAGKIIMHAQKNTAIVGTFHIFPYGPLQSAANFVLGHMQRRSLSRYDQTCAVSGASMKFASRSYGLKPDVIPNAIDFSQWKSHEKPQPGKIVFLGRLVARKGCKEFLLALSALPESELQKYKIVIAGDGPERLSLQRLAQKLPLNTNFIGYVPEKDKPALLASAELAVFPSLGGESFGIVLLEAMAAGAGLVVGGDNPGYRCVLGETPECLINFRDSKSAAVKLLGIITDKADQNRLRIIQQQVARQYDVEIVGPQILAMYQSAMLHRKQYVR